MHHFESLAAVFLGVAAIFWLFLPLAALFTKRGGNSLVWPVFVGLGAIAVLGCAFFAYGEGALVNIPLGLGSVGAQFKFDPLSSWYLGVIGLVTVLLTRYLHGYLDHLKKTVDLRIFWIALPWLLMSMAATVLAANVQTFLVAWEVMSLTSFLLVATSHEQHSSARSAALIYLGATRIGTAALIAGFLWAHVLSGSWSFADWHLSGVGALGPGLLILVGLGVKAGMWPFHLWLPVAHPAAPAPVSALMSGVMIKVATAVMIRLFVLSPAFTHPAFGFVILTLGSISALWGVLFALMQHDLKRLLAFHSIENIGLILMGIGAGLVARQFGLIFISEIALAAALFHVLNHALFKSLLFLGAGSVDVGAGTRDLSMLGGLGKRMPVTYACFTLGAAAICGLPPLNGFASEWLLIQSLLHLGGSAIGPLPRFISLLLIGLIGLVGALAMACFIKVVGVVFQGRPRSPGAEHAHEATAGMRFSQVCLAIACVLLGLAAPVVLRILQPIVAPGAPRGSLLSDVWTLPIGVTAALLIGTIAACMLWMNRAASLIPMRRYITWECGFGDLNSRAQVAGASFVQPIARMFKVVFRYAENLRVESVDKRLFLDDLTAVATSESMLETRFYRPAARWFGRLGDRVLRLQEGSIHRYLLTMFVTLIVLLIVGGYIR